MRYSVTEGDEAFYIYDHARGRTVDLPGDRTREEADATLATFLAENAQADSDALSELAYG